MGDGTDDATMTFSGTIADVNAALDGLTFTPTASYTGPASLRIQTSDLGQYRPRRHADRRRHDRHHGRRRHQHCPHLQCGHGYRYHTDRDGGGPEFRHRCSTGRQGPRGGYDAQRGQL